MADDSGSSVGGDFVGQDRGAIAEELACPPSADLPGWSLDRTVNVVDAATLVATLALAFAAVWYFEPKHARRTAAFEILGDALASASDAINEIEQWTIREAPASRSECEQLLVHFRAAANALWLIDRFAARRKCGREVRELVVAMSKVRQSLYDHLTGTQFPAEGFTLDAERRIRATSMIGLFRKHALNLRAELVGEL